MTHLTRIMQNVVKHTPYKVTRGATGRITSRVRLKDTEYDSKRSDHVIEPNVVISIGLDRGQGSLAINLSEALLAALQNDPVLAAVWSESDALKHWSAVNVANRAGRATLKPDTAAPAFKPNVTVLPLDADPATIKASAEQALKDRTAALIAKARKAKAVPATASPAPAK